MMAPTLFLCAGASAQEKTPLVRLVKITIDSAQLDAYKAALKEGIETAIRVEPGVLKFFAVYEKDRPTQVTILEVYADSTAYKSHLQTPHFKKYKSTTMNMVKSFQLADVIPIAFETKPN